MKLSNLRSKIAYSLVAGAVAAAGVVAFADTTKPATDPAAPAATAPATAPAGPLVSVNFKALDKDSLFNIMLINGGFAIFDQFYAFAVVTDALETSNIKLSQADIDAFRKELGQKIKIEGATIEDKDRDGILLQYLQRQNIMTQAQLQWYLWTLCGLKTIQERTAKETLTLTPSEQAEAKAIAYGAHVEIVDFIFKKSDDGTKILEELAKGTPIADLARKYPNQPMTIPLSRKSMINAEFHKYIFDQKDGAFNKAPFLDPVKKEGTDQVWHIIYVNKNVAANDKPAEAEVTKMLEQAREQKESQWRNLYLLKLKVLALKQVNFNDDIMKGMFNNYAAQLVNQFNNAVAQAQDPQSQPATATAPATAPGK